MLFRSARVFRSVGILAIPEPPSLFRSDGNRPDGMTLLPWSRGLSLMWDFTCPDTLAPSHLPHTSHSAGAAASSAEFRKISKYRDLALSYAFAPVAVETMGVWVLPQSISFVNLVVTLEWPQASPDRPFT